MVDIEIIREKLLGVQVCSDITPNDLKNDIKKSEFESKVNLIHSCGTTNGWVLSDRKEHNPVKCESEKDKWHYIFIC